MNNLWKRLTGNCLPWFHRYRISLWRTERVNDGALLTRGSKVYECAECGKIRVVWPRDIF